MKWWGKLVDKVTGTKRVKVRARDEDGRFLGDDESTPDVNEAYEEIRVKKAKK
jgi:hypothetical protein